MRKEDKVIQVGNHIEPKGFTNPQCGRVYSALGVSPTVIGNIFERKRNARQGNDFRRLQFRYTETYTERVPSPHGCGRQAYRHAYRSERDDEEREGAAGDKQQRALPPRWQQHSGELHDAHVRESFLPRHRADHWRPTQTILTHGEGKEMGERVPT